jgi:hypothetical protein
VTFSARLHLAVECALVLFACTAGPATVQVWLTRAEASGYWMVVGVPLCAAVVFILLSLTLPALYAVSGLRYPLQVTLPVVYTCLLPVCAALWTTTPEELMANFESTRYAFVWQQPGALLIAGGAQILGMVLLTAIRQDL